MKCHDMPEMLVSLLYGELDDHEAAQVHAHIEQCDACRAEWEELQSTTQILEKWDDLSPVREHLFIEDRSTWKDQVAAWMKSASWSRKIAWGIPLFAGACLLLLSLMNFEAEYTDGQWHIAFGNSAQRNNARTQAFVAEAMKQYQQETLLLVSDLLEDSENRQQQSVNTLLTSFAQKMELRRQQDLKLMGQGLEGLHLTTQGQLQQNSRAIDDLMRLTNYKLDKK